MGGPENGNFPLLYVVKMALCRWVGGSKKAQNALTYSDLPNNRAANLIIFWGKNTYTTLYLHVY